MPIGTAGDERRSGAERAACASVSHVRPGYSLADEIRQAVPLANHLLTRVA